MLLRNKLARARQSIRLALRLIAGIICPQCGDSSDQNYAGLNSFLCGNPNCSNFEEGRPLAPLLDIGIAHDEDMENIAEIMDVLTKKWVEGKDYDWYIARGDDIPNGAIIYSKDLLESPEGIEIASWEGETTYEKDWNTDEEDPICSQCEEAPATVLEQGEHYCQPCHDDQNERQLGMASINPQLQRLRQARKFIGALAKKAEKPKKVTEIADAIRRDNPGTSDEAAYRQAWETYCSYVNSGYDGCTSKGKSKRKSPKSEY